MKRAPQHEAVGLTLCP